MSQTEHSPPAARSGAPPRVGDLVTLSARVTGAIPNGAAATVRVYDRGRGDGERLLATLRGTVKDRMVAVPWRVTGRAGYRVHELQLEFDVEAGGIRTARARLPLARERLVEIEIAGGAGALELDADLPLYVVKTGVSLDRPTFAGGERFRAELPSGYQGRVAVNRGGRPLVAITVASMPLGADDPIRVRCAPAQAAQVPTGLTIPTPSRVAAEATRVQPPSGAMAGSGSDETLHVHTLRRPAFLRDGAHELRELTDRAYRAFMEEVFGTDLPPSIVSAIQSRAILREFGTRFYIKGGRYVVFRGSPALRKYLTATRYRVDHPKVLVLTSGGRAGVGRALADGFRASRVALVIVGALDVVEGIQKGSSWTDILVDVASDTAKGLVGTAIGVGLVAGAAVFFPALLAAAPVGVVVVAGIGLGILIGQGLDWLDGRAGATDAVRRAAHASVRLATPPVSTAAGWIADAWDDLVAQPLAHARHAAGGAVADLERNILQLYQLPGAARP